MTARAGNLVTIEVAAGELGVGVKTLRRMLREGAPQARVGRRGRGRRALLDVNAIAAWRASRNGTAGEPNCAALEVLAAQIPDILADAAWRAFGFVESDPLLTARARRALVGALLFAWTEGSTGLRERIARDAPNVAVQLTVEPEKIGQLARHFRPDK